MTQHRRARLILARRMRLLRASRGWTQETLAELSGLHRTYISGIERASRNIGIDALEKLATAFGLTLAELLDEGSGVR